MSMHEPTWLVRTWSGSVLCLLSRVLLLHLSVVLLFSVQQRQQLRFFLCSVGLPGAWCLRCCRWWRCLSCLAHVLIA